MVFAVNFRGVAFLLKELKIYMRGRCHFRRGISEKITSFRWLSKVITALLRPLKSLKGLQHGPLQVISRVMTPLIGVIIPDTHLSSHLQGPHNSMYN